MAEHWNGGSGGKGSKPRPYSVDQKTFDSNWDNIFGKKKKTEAEKFDEQVIMKDEYYDTDTTDSDSSTD
jgi:hypothetical protein